MNEHRYRLEKYKGKNTRHTCPSCKGKLKFARYIDVTTGEQLAEDVGRCNAEVNCGYHFTPSQYFTQNPDKKGASNWEVGEYKPAPKVNIPADIMQLSVNLTSPNSFIDYLNTLFPPCVVSSLVFRYNIGTSKYYKGGGAVFYFVNKAGEVRAGQVKLFDTSGHTATFTTTEGEVRKVQNAVHEIIKKQCIAGGLPVPGWIEPYIAQELRIDCFFGEHLLALPENDSKPIAIVEAPKTAIVASAYFPQFVWLAVGALSYLKRERCGVLFGRNVHLFPDLKAADNWKARIANEGLDSICNIDISTYLEDNATDQEKDKGLDLCDYLERVDYIQFLKDELIKDMTKAANPDDVVMRFFDRGMSREYFKSNVWPVLVNEHNFTTA